jgi:hypothetical protein
VHRADHGEYAMSQTNDYGSYPSPDTQLTDKPHEFSLDNNAEGRDEKQ